MKCAKLSEERAAPERVRRKRGIGFPVVDLSEAVRVLRTAGRHGSEHSITAFATYLGHSTPNSGSFKRRLAAFRDWKFIAGSTGDRIVFTDLGRRVAYPGDAAKARQDIQEAFRNCELFMRVWDDSAKGVPMDLEALANLAVQELGVAPVSKERFAKSLAVSACVAGFARQVGDKISFIQPDAGRHKTVDLEVSVDERMAEEPMRMVIDERASIQKSLNTVGVPDEPRLLPVVGAVAAGRPVSVDELEDEEDQVAASVRFRDTATVTGGVGGRDQVNIYVTEKPALLHQQSWEFGGGSLNVEIRFNRALPAEAFIQLGKVMAEVEKLKSILAENSESEKSE